MKTEDGRIIYFGKRNGVESETISTVFTIPQAEEHPLSRPASPPAGNRGHSGKQRTYNH